MWHTATLQRCYASRRVAEWCSRLPSSYVIISVVSCVRTQLSSCGAAVDLCTCAGREAVCRRADAPWSDTHDGLMPRAAGHACQSLQPAWDGTRRQILPYSRHVTWERRRHGHGVTTSPSVMSATRRRRPAPTEKVRRLSLSLSLSFSINLIVGTHDVRDRVKLFPVTTPPPPPPPSSRLDA